MTDPDIVCPDLHYANDARAGRSGAREGATQRSSVTMAGLTAFNLTVALAESKAVNAGRIDGGRRSTCHQESGEQRSV